jgi:pyruvate formate-lyase/glycerol dehydratase family glycyl radical enzyme
MFELREITPRVQRLRERYRDAVPVLDAERVGLLTDYYKVSEKEQPVLRRANALHQILANMTIRVEPDELIVGNVSRHFRGCNLWPEWGGIGWLIQELDSGAYDRKTAADGYMTLDETDREYLHSVESFWQEHSISATVDAAMPPELSTLAGAGVLTSGPAGNGAVPSGHFNANYRKVVEKGFGAIRQEALGKLEKLNGKITGDDAEKWFFYRAVVTCSDAIILFAKRYAAECRRLAAECLGEDPLAQSSVDQKRREELLRMADSLDWIMENPARTFHEALQACFLYHLVLSVEGSYLGLTIGRVDQHVGDYLHADLEAGRITLDEAQELMDCFFLKMADLFLSGPVFLLRAAGAYSNNMRITIGGRKPDGSDATNEATYLCLQSTVRLQLHDPNLSLCLHNDSPAELWEAGIETSKKVGGIPTLDNADRIAEILHKRGLSVEDARNFCVCGCVEYSGSGCEYANASGPFSKAFVNLNNILLLAINNGVNPLNELPGGLQTGLLSDMETFDEVKEAFRTQLEYFLDWQFTIYAICERVGIVQMPVPIASATMDGCMESGRDMMWGGAKYNSTGVATMGIGTLADSLAAIKYMVYDKKLCTGRQLLDAVLADWKGHELLRQRIKNEVPCYGNGDPYVDELATWAAHLFADKVNSYVGPRGVHQAGLYSAAANILTGYFTHATPNGRLRGEPLSDAATPSNDAEKCGPTGVMQSVLALDSGRFGNGLQFNMKFHPTSLQGPDGNDKLRRLVEAFFEQGGQQVQYNVIDSEVLRKAQAQPEEYRNLVVRVAGFSAFFVELYEDLQNHLIARAELSV